MPYSECKIYSDGSHYIAIPHTSKPFRKRTKPKEEEITVTEESAFSDNGNAPVPLVENIKPVEDTGSKEEPVAIERKTTRKELFEELYAEYRNEKKYKRRNLIISAMRPYFKEDWQVKNYVDLNLQRKRRNLIVRRIRMVRKANLATFNYFVTFTYNGELHTEESFKKGLKTALRHLSERKGWKYMGVWERSPEKHRLHFHGLFDIPENTMPGIIFEKNDYNFNTHRRQITHQNTYFNERFGRSDFEPIDDKSKLGNAVAYILKYIEKTGEKIVYSKGLPQFFISDVVEEDIVCPFGLEDKKLLLFDNFKCWDEGCLIGNVSKETIQKLRKSN